MKTGRSAFREGRRLQLLQEVVHDSYKSKRKLAGPTSCRRCGAVYRRGRWRWESAPRGASTALCPACQRIRDRLPAGYVTLGGRFFARHRDEILARVRSCEDAEKRTHPMQRIMAISRNGAGMLVTTTDAHLGRRIGDALRDAYKGKLEVHYNPEDNLLRVLWSR